MTSRTVEPIRAPARGRARFEAGNLSAVVAHTRPPVAQLRQQGTVAATSLPARCSAISTNAAQRSQRQEEEVAARALARSSATGYPFMDIGILGPPSSRSPLRLPLDRAHSLAIGFSISRTIVGVSLSVAPILALLGELSSLRHPPSLPPQPASPPCGFPAAGGTTVLGAEPILSPGDEPPPAALEEAPPSLLSATRQRP